MRDRQISLPSPRHSPLVRAGIDSGLIIASLAGATMLATGTPPAGGLLPVALAMMIVVTLLGWVLGLYGRTRGHRIGSDLLRVVLVAVAAALVGAAMAALMPVGEVADSVFAMTGMSYLIMSSTARIWWYQTGSGRPSGRAFDPAVLLGREALENELPDVSEGYTGKIILVTGAGGSIGSELCRQLALCKPKSLVLMDHGEHALFEIEHELRSLAPELEIIPILGSVCEAALVTVLMRAKKIDVVLHAAAYKHVPMVESNAIEGMRNNVIGTRTVAHAARDAGVELFILVSTDKAVRPKSVMGASKRFAEMIVQDLATRSPGTRFSMVRFGNVLGSSGSVIPTFTGQIARGGPITLTHPDVTRFFMTIAEAVRLVLLAGTFARGGDVFVLDMGNPVKVRDIALRMIKAWGLRPRDEENPYGDIEIAITGLRPGEKLHEELLIGSDMLTTPHPRILRAQEGHLSELELMKALKSLSESIETRDVALLRRILGQWIEQTTPEAAREGR